MQRWRRKLGDVEQHSHWMHARVRRFTLGKLNGRDAQRPDISLAKQTQMNGNDLMYFYRSELGFVNKLSKWATTRHTDRLT